MESDKDWCKRNAAKGSNVGKSNYVRAALADVKESRGRVLLQVRLDPADHVYWQEQGLCLTYRGDAYDGDDRFSIGYYYDYEFF